MFHILNIPLPNINIFPRVLWSSCICVFPINAANSKNRAIVGTVLKDMKGPLFPTVAVHSQNEEYVSFLSCCIQSSTIQVLVS